MFRTRRMPRFAVAATLVAAASLSMAACQSGTGVEKTGKAPAESSPASPERKGSGEDAPESAPQGTGDTPAQETGTGGDGDAAAPADHKRSTGREGSREGGDASATSERCGPSDVELVVRQVSRPINHMLLTVTNTGGAVCDVYGYPLLRFDEAHTPTPPVEDSAPQAVISLRPGESAYAGITTYTPDNGDSVSVTKLGVLLTDRDGRAVEGDRPVTLTLPSGTGINAGARVTYWQADQDAALMW
ncbi:DUF4232 domain-containing protein [Streptomyces macrosporus]|uniref:DUF4232 domain-containing protein n=1 Tax=Streptomyces macrosporus TaxID=44032 RepID=A0ABP5XI26_9ACTN